MKMKNQLKEENIDGIKVALAIRQLERSEVFHESLDVEEEGVENLLQKYGIFFKWTKEEKEILKTQLLEMAGIEEIREAIRWATLEHDSLIASIPERPMPNPKLLEIQHNIWKAEMKKKQGNRDETEPAPPFKNIINEKLMEVK